MKNIIVHGYFINNLVNPETSQSMLMWIKQNIFFTISLETTIYKNIFIVKRGNDDWWLVEDAS